jgi:tetratricopeptide (TPR) repeat protein
MTTRAPLLVLCLLLLASPLAAQMDMAEHGGKPPALGRVRFPSSCSAAAAASVERGVALLHSFWYEEAGHAFGDAARADSTCALAYWGEATSLMHPLWAPSSAQDVEEGAALSARAREANAPTPRERGYVDAISAFYAGGAQTRFVDRVRAWSDGLKRLHDAEPADTEATIFFGLSLVAVAQNSPPDTTYALQRQAGDLLEPLFQVEPNHPGLAHYLIHAYDSPALADRAVRAADRYASIAPSVPHARHMPSHIYTRLGMWDASIASNIGAATAARQYEIAQRMDAVWDQRLHAMDYLAYAYLQEGRDAAARRLVAEAARMQKFTPPHASAAEYALAAIPARYALERGRWREAAALTLRPDLVEPGAIAVTHFARAIGAARGGDTADARNALAALASVDDALAQARVPIWPGTVHAQRLAASAWLALAEADTTSALRLASEAADLEEATPKHPVTPGAILPARELQGDLLLAVGRPAEALAAYTAALARAPKRARGLAGAIRAATRAGDQATARRLRQEYRTLMAHADRERARLALGPS